MPFNSPELVLASHGGDLATVMRPVESGGYVYSVCDYGLGPLLCFWSEVAEYWLAQGADPNRQTNASGHAVLRGIAYFTSAPCVRLLLAAGADVKAVVRETGETALH